MNIETASAFSWVAESKPYAICGAISLKEDLGACLPSEKLTAIGSTSDEG
jgi:hypothetical protein